MKIFDTHAHLCDSSFDEDLEEVLNRAAGAGVCTVVAVSEDLSDARKNLQLSETYSLIRTAAGLYPANLDQRQAGERKEPANSRIAIEIIARLKGETVRKVAEEVFKNSCRFYRKIID